MFGLWLTMYKCNDATSNPNLDACSLTAWRDNDYSNTQYGPFECGDYDSSNDDFDDDQIDSAQLYAKSGFTCYGYFFEDDFSDTVLLMNASDGSTQSYSKFDDYNEGDKLSSLSLRYEIKSVCKVSFYLNDNQVDQTGNSLGIGGMYTKWMLESRDITNDAVSSIKVEGDDSNSCITYLYSDESCTSDKCVVNGTGSFSTSQLEELGFVNNAMSCVIVTAGQGLNSDIIYNEDNAVFKNEESLIVATQTYENTASGTTISQTVSLEHEENYDFSYSSSHDITKTVSQDITVKVLSAESKTSFSYADEVSWSTTYSGSITDTITQTITTTIESGNTVECSLQVSKSALVVPYTATFQYIDEYYQYYNVTQHGNFTSSAFYDSTISCVNINTDSPTTESPIPPPVPPPTPSPIATVSPTTVSPTTVPPTRISPTIPKTTESLTVPLPTQTPNANDNNNNNNDDSSHSTSHYSTTNYIIVQETEASSVSSGSTNNDNNSNSNDMIKILIIIGIIIVVLLIIIICAGVGYCCYQQGVKKASKVTNQTHGHYEKL